MSIWGLEVFTVQCPGVAVLCGLRARSAGEQNTSAVGMWVSSQMASPASQPQDRREHHRLVWAGKQCALRASPGPLSGSPPQLCGP